MSGRPNITDIALLRDALSIITKENAVIEQATADLTRAEKARDGALARRDAAFADVRKLMDRMDCSATRNSGHEGRLLSLLAGLSDHAERYGRAHP